MKRGNRLLALAPGALLMAALAMNSLPASKPDRIKFDHGFHIAEAGLTCADCHNGIENAPALMRAIPGHDVCATCHEQVNQPEQCGVCHSNPENAAAAPPRAGRYEGFAHQRHNAAGIGCAECHGEVAGGVQPQVPVMADCQSCHSRKGAALECAQCHQGATPQPADHLTAAWLAEHGQEALAGSSDCAACHRQSSCDACHQGYNLAGAKGSPHPVGWLFNHFAEADFGAECLSCHETRTSCVSCHRAMLPVPHSFGPEFADPVSGGEHSQEFEASPQACLACHDLGKMEPTCARCHVK